MLMTLDEIEERRGEILNQFNNGKTIDELKNKYQVRRIYIYEIVASEFIHARQQVPKEYESQICDLYVKGWSCTRIAEAFKVYHKAINLILEEHQIQRIGNGLRKYTLDEHYFDEIDNQNKAYFLGLLYADGNNSMQKRTIRLSLNEDDKPLLERLRKEIKSNKPLDLFEQSKRHDNNNYHYRDMWTLKLFSEHLCKQLSALGVVPNKSLVLKYPNWLREDLHRHFLRGYFDGDGSLCGYKYKQNGCINHIITFTSTEDFCKSAKQILTNTLGTNGGIYDASCHNGITKVLSISGFNQNKKILDWLYVDAEIYMKRKYDKYINLFYAA